MSSPNSLVKCEAVVFDLDGTLIDNSLCLHHALNRLFLEEGRDPIHIEAVRKMVGGGAFKIVKRSFAATGEIPDKADLRRLGHRFKELCYGEAARLTKVYPGVASTLERLKRQAIKLAICTKRPRQHAEDALARLNLKDYFTMIWGGDNPSARKPDPQVLLAVLAKLGTSVEKAVMVGDKANDVAMARGAGVPVVAVSYGFSGISPEDLGADVLIDRFAELPRALAVLSSRHS